MKSKSKYILQPAAKSYCPECQADLTLLCREDGNMKQPWFYICFICKIVTQVGTGPVLRFEKVKWDI